MTPFDFGRGDRVLVVAPHPDDETLGAGVPILSALEAGASVRVVFATDGEANEWVHRLVERRLFIGSADRARFGARRRGEALAALSVLGVGPGSVEFLALPDDGITALLLGEDPRPWAALAGAVARARPTVLIGPSLADLHPDHSAIAVLLRHLVASSHGMPRPRRQVEFTVHRARRAQASPTTLRVAPTPLQARRLRAAIDEHETPMAVHRDAFHAAVMGPANFEDATGATDAVVHPVLAIARDDDGLTIRIRSRARLGAFGPAVLVLLTAPPKGPTRAFRVALGRRRGTAHVERAGTRLVEGRGSLRRSGGETEVRLPYGAIGREARIFAKVERRFGFFDEAGWLEVAASPRGVAERPSERDGLPSAARPACESARLSRSDAETGSTS